MKQMIFNGVIAIAVAAGFYVQNKTNNELKSQLDEITPIVAVDFVQVAAQYGTGASEEELEKLMMQTNNAILKLRDAGYLVIDAAAVVQAPQGIVLGKELVPDADD